MSDGTRACQRKAHGLDNVRTMKSQGARSLPKSHSDVYIDLFVLHKEKERLQKELAETEKRAEKTTKRLSEIGARICKMEAAYLEYLRIAEKEQESWRSENEKQLMER